jgi:nitrile hydratase accessory protein
MPEHLPPTAHCPLPTAPLYQRHRNLVRRADGRLVNVARSRGHLFVCSDACCCGRTEDGMAPVPVDLYHAEWERRRLRNIVHLTIGGCLGPCALANVAMLLFDGQALWFHSVNDKTLVLALYDYAESMLDAGSILPPPEPLAALQFTADTWQPRPDGAAVDDQYRWQRRRSALTSRPPLSILGEGESSSTLVAEDSPLPGLGEGSGVRADPPRKNGELIFDEPWESRAFGMAVALNEDQCYPWENFRRRLIGQIAEADARDDPAGYYERWLAAFEQLLDENGIISKDELDERTFEFEFGERDDVF